MMKLNEAFWNSRYLNGTTGWDLGKPSQPLYQYLCQIQDKNLMILVPGGGNAHEVKAAWNMGFKNVFLLDISEIPLKKFSERNPDFPLSHLIHGDFFDHKEKYDLILEQTFFCALDPSLRKAYAEKMHQLLNSGGSLVGVLFNRQFVGGPPFGGDSEEYRGYFEPFFELEIYEACRNSEPPRAGNEWFIKLKKSNSQD